MTKRLAALAAASLVAALQPMFSSSLAQSRRANENQQIRIIEQIRKLVENEYFYADKIPTGRYTDIYAYMKELDSHSGYITGAEFDAMRPGATPTRGSVGLELILNQSVATVVSATPGRPAARAGIEPGDVLARADGVPVGGDSLEAAEKALVGPLGQKVALTIRKADGRSHELELVREAYDTRTVEAARLGDIAYLRISNLRETTPGEIRTTLRSASMAQPGGVILDLRNCPGGLFDTAIEVTGLFAGGRQVVTQRGRRPADNQQHRSRAGDQLVSVPMVVITNSLTTSGCEIIAAALQDHGRATVVGMPTGGEGTVQTVHPLRGGRDGAVKFTTSLIYRPSGKAIADGVLPDTLVANSQGEVTVFTLIKTSRTPRSSGVPGPGSDLTSDLRARLETPPAGYKGDYQLERARAVIGVDP